FDVPKSEFWRKHSFPFSQLLYMARTGIRGVLVDLSGTLHIGSKPIDGAPAALERLLAAGIAVRFVTNTTKKPVLMLARELHEVGFDTISEPLIFSTPVAARTLLQQRGLRPLLLVDPTLLPDFSDFDTTSPNAVVVGLAVSELNYPRLNKQAFRLLMDGAPLIALHKGRYQREADGGLSLGPGPFVAGLEYAAGVSAEVVGKPSPGFFHAALSGIGCQPSEAVMIGDDLADDVAGAQNAGMRGILVRTGKYRAGDEESGDVRPDVVCDSFVQAVDWILGGDNTKET
ncbi:unnamed protein product, partial [Phaeothamnion confervicola]